MRIIAGKYKNRDIAAPPGKATRPVLSRVRKAIFDTAAPVVEGGRILDLFAGSGGFVIEALSRGAAAAVAIDLDAGAVKAIRGNLAKCGVREPVEVYKNDAFDAIGKLAARGQRFELISVAPPYWKGLQARALLALDAADLLAPGGLLFVQRDAKEDVTLEQPLTRLALAKQKVYGNTIVDWYGGPVSEVPDTVEES
ncbi:MAG TPA: 16S rRNA (guanine(966)-N(2))-methyltransferase RsmD [Planctomycetota bacterium]|nr:16S rRNA (guanine(966)-N(2))-methyltransferase RsmD [Planctomycetota bacterium]